MSTGGTGGHPRGLGYGASAAQQKNVGLSDDPDPKGTAAGYTPDQNQGKSFLGFLKEALKPGDTKRKQHHMGLEHAGEFTHDGRHGSIEQTMIRGHRDYDESQEGPQSHGDGDGMRTGGGMPDPAMPGRRDRGSKERGGGIVGAMKSASDNASNVSGTLKKAVGGGDSESVGQSVGADSGFKKRGGSTGKTARNSKFEKIPAAETYLGPRPDEGEDATIGVSTLDSQGSVGHQFSPEGAIGDTAQKVGGPLSKEGIVGRQFTDKGSVGGTVQDTLGHGNATRKGT
ncbi:hypothetical protein GGR54DRAFT_526820 [Hypoxylon sp. NC1633]|nr:hypothetical protein GGR54DRAFT_526820 [Hypoxylon sp. NC1633]